MVDGLIISILNELAHVLNDHVDIMPRKDNGQMGTWTSSTKASSILV